MIPTFHHLLHLTEINLLRFYPWHFQFSNDVHSVVFCQNTVFVLWSRPVARTPSPGAHGHSGPVHHRGGSQRAVPNLSKSEYTTLKKKKKKSHYKIKKIDQRAESLRSFQEDTQLGAGGGLGPGCARRPVSGRRLGALPAETSQQGSARPNLRGWLRSLLKTKVLNGLVLSVLSTTMQFSSQGILATLNLSKNRGFWKIRL